MKQTFLLMIAAMLKGENPFTTLLQIKLELLTIDQQEILAYIRKFYVKYGGFPSIDLLESELGISLPDPSESFAYYLDKLKDNFIMKEIQTAFLSCQDKFTKGRDYAPQGAIEVLQRTLGNLLVSTENSIVDFRNAKQLIADDYAKMNSLDYRQLTVGYPTIDSQMGGLVTGERMDIIGRPGMGKTFIMLWIAYHIWRTYNVPVVFFSLEVPVIRIVQRLAAIYAECNLTHLIKGDLSPDLLPVFFNTLEDLTKATAPFEIVSNSFNISSADVLSYVQYKKPAVVFVDGAYLLNEPIKASKTELIAQIARRLKSIPMETNTCFVASWQLNRQAEQKKKGTLSLGDIYYSDEIGQTSALTLAIVPENQIAEVSTKHISILKGRDGQEGEFRINWNFSNGVDLSEVPFETSQSLEFL